MRIPGIIGLAIASVLAVSLHADPIIGGRIQVQADGNVTATYLAGYGFFSDDLLLYLPTNNHGVIFNSKTTPMFTTFDLGSFVAGTELEFAIYVLNTGATWYSGEAANNSDGKAHAMVINDWTPGNTLIGFEDMLNAGDKDYDDLAFTLNNTVGLPAAVPEPGSLVLFGLGALALGVSMRRFRA